MTERLAIVSAPTRTTTNDPLADGSALTVTRWFKYGKRRLYVNTTDGVQVGWVDLASGERTLARPGMADAFEAAIASQQTETPEPYIPRHALREPTPPAEPQRAAIEPAPPALVLPTQAVAPAPAPPPKPWTDLAINLPGQGARERAKEELADMRDRKGAFMTFLARGFDVKTDERSWRVGANGEETVGGRLEKLRADGWQLLHSVPVGTRGSDIDHVLVGTGGIYTINTKTHPNGKIWVGKTTVIVNGHKQPYQVAYVFEFARRSTTWS